MKEMTFSEFCEVLGRMTNDEFCSFITFYKESSGSETLLTPISFNEEGFIEWIGRFTENGEPNNDDCKIIVENILKNASNFDYVLIEYLSSDSTPFYNFFTKANLKEVMFKHPIIEELYKDKAAWGNSHYLNGAKNDLYTMFSKHLNKYDLIVGIFYYRDEDDCIEVDKLLIAEHDVDKEYVKNIDNNICVFEKIGVADSYSFLSTEATYTVYVKNEIDYQRINALPFYKGHVEIVNDWDKQ